MSTHNISLDDLEALEAHQLELLRSCTETVSVCTGSTCAAQGASELRERIEKEVAALGIDGQCQVKGVGCNGLCSSGIVVSTVDREHCGKKDKSLETVYGNVRPDDAGAIAAAMRSGEPVERLVCDTSIPFFAKQTKIVLENAGYVDPEEINDYIAHHGYFALFDALTHCTPAEVLATVKQSGLRGRGGGGFPTGLKWETVAKMEGTKKYIVCNGDEGDPGAFMDRAVMEADPHRVLEGMALAGYAVGAQKGYIYVRAEYPTAVEMLRKAIKQAEKLGVLGNNIAGSSFSFQIEIRLGAGAFVCGEATALVTSIEGNRGQPRQKPPHLSTDGLWHSPTILNNVETFANVPPILRNGAEWFRSFGTEGSPGTKVFALTGQITHTGLVEVPMGMTLREIIMEIGGGCPEGRAFKAVQTGGPSGGCIPEQLLDTPVDYDSLKAIGSIMGSGGMIIMDDMASMVDVARFFMQFCADESCGKCVPCRVGTAQMHALLTKLSDKTATPGELAMLKTLCGFVKATSLCGLGKTAANPVLSTLRYFEGEYLDAIKDET